MRIIAGTHRGTALADMGKGDAAAHLRPTTDRVRENIFNVLLGGRFGDPITGARVLDVFAGTGALGLEALSRGAANVTFVDNGASAQKLITANVKRLGRQDRTELMRIDALFLPAGTPHDLIFLDPPYGKDLGTAVLTILRTQNYIAKDALIVCEDNSALIAPDGFHMRDQRRYGQTWVMFLQAEL